MARPAFVITVSLLLMSLEQTTHGTTSICHHSTFTSYVTGTNNTWHDQHSSSQYVYFLCRWNKQHMARPAFVITVSLLLMSLEQTTHGTASIRHHSKFTSYVAGTNNTWHYQHSSSQYVYFLCRWNKQHMARPAFIITVSLLLTLLEQTTHGETSIRHHSTFTSYSLEQTTHGETSIRHHSTFTSYVAGTNNTWHGQHSSSQYVYFLCRWNKQHMARPAFVITVSLLRMSLEQTTYGTTSIRHHSKFTSYVAGTNNTWHDQHSSSQ